MNLPPLPPSPLVKTMGFEGYHAQDMRAYGQQCAKHALLNAAIELCDKQWLYKSVESQVRSMMSEYAVNCNPHPDAPHAFDRQGSRNAGRYVCACESWTPGDAS